MERMVMPISSKTLFIVILALFIALFFIVNSLSYNQMPVTIITDEKEITVIAEIADNPIEQSRGLMFREHLGENEGMIFVFSGNEKRGFWMKNTLIPLDLIFVAENFTIVDIKENFEPCKSDPCPSYVSKPAAYVLEVNAGFVKKHNIKIGDRMQLG